MKIFRQICFLCFGILLGLNMFAQQPINDDCINASEITYNGNTGCLTGTLKNASDDLVNIPSSPQCPNPNTGNEVWYFFKASNINTEIRLLSPNFTNAHLNLFSGDCTNRLLITCGESNTGEVTLNVGTNIGETYYITVSDGNLNQGNFTICVESNNVPNSPGNNCSEAVTVCSKERIVIEETNNITSSATIPPCFNQGGMQISVVKDSWFRFTVTKSGSLEFIAFPKENLQEIDFALYDITDGCPGSLLSCNYSFTTGTGVTSPTGIWNNDSIFANPDEINPPIPVVANRTYAILIDNYNGDPDGFDLVWGGTFDLSTRSDFSADKIFDCGPFTANFTNQSIGANSLLWTFPDASTSNAQTPTYNFTNPGENIVRLDVSNNRNNCKSSFSSRFIVNNININNSIPDSSICVGESIQFTNTADSISLSSPVQFAYNTNNTFDNGNPLNAVGLTQNLFPVNYTSGDLKEVCFSLSHNNLSEIEINLLSPSGTRLNLIKQDDLSGQKIDKVCFRDDAIANINSVAAPYSGTFKSPNNFDAFIGSSKDGFWTLELRSAIKNKNTGFFYDWSLTFKNENETTISWVPNTYLSDPNILNPTLQSPQALLENENIFYKIQISDNTGCSDIENSNININKASKAGRDSSLYFCENLNQINLFDLLSSDATQDGNWFDENNNQTGNIFNPSNFLGQTLIRFYKILGPAAKCGEDSAKFTLQVRQDTSITYNIPDKICIGQSNQVNLSSNLQGFVQFFASYPSRDTSIIINGFPKSFSLNSGQIPFTIDSIKFDNNKCTLPVNKLINPESIDQPKLVLDSTVCNPTSTAYIAFLSIVGGETASLEVNGQNASNRQVQSSPIASGTSFLFECKDANECSIDSLMVNVRCDCKSRAGTFNNALSNSICDSDTLLINHNGDAFLDPNDASEYIITTMPFPNFGNFITRDFYNNNVPLFLTPQYQTNTNYYLTFVSGNKDANQRVDIQDDCTDFSESIQFSFSETPKGKIFLGVNSICKNAPAPVNYNLNAGQPNFTFFRNGDAIFVSNTFNGSFNTSFTQDTVFYIDSVLSDNGCVGYDFLKDSSQINVVDFPEFDNVNFMCDGTAENYILSFTTINGDEASATVNGNIALNKNGRNYTSNLLPSGTAFNITVSDKNMCQSTILDSLFTCDCISMAPEINALNNGGFICEDDSLRLVLRDDNNDGLPNFKQLDDNDVQSVMILNNIADTALSPIPFVMYSDKTVYGANEFALDQSYFAVITIGTDNGNGLANLNDKCLSYSNIIQFRTVSTPSISSLGNDSICLGEAIMFDVNNTSKFSTSFSLINSVGTESFNFDVNAGSSTQSFTPSNVGRNAFFISNVIDGSPANCSGNWLGDSVIVNVLPSPQIQFLNTSDVICPGESFTVNYNISSDATVEFDLLFNNVLLQTITTENGNGSFTFTPTEEGLIEAQNLKTLFSGGSCNGIIINDLTVNIHNKATFTSSFTPSTPCISDVVNINFLSNKSNYTLEFLSDNNESISTASNQLSFNYTTKSTKDSIIYNRLLSSDISSQSGNVCIYNLDSTIYINSNAVPTLNINPLFTNPVCQNDYAVFEYTASGTPNYIVNISNDGNTRQLNSNSNVFLDSVLIGPNNINYSVINISDVFCSSSINTDFTIVSTPAQVADILLTSTEVCEPVEVNLTNNTTNLNSCEWTLNGLTKSNNCSGFSEIVNATPNLNYSFSYTDVNGCKNVVQSNSLEVLVSPVAQFTFTPEFPNINSPIVQCKNLSQKYTETEWTLNGNLTSTEENPIIDLPPVIDVENTILLTVYNTNGCFDTASVKIFLEPNLTIYIPNAFTPDNDGINDCFEVVSSGASQQGFVLSIYNRWGEVIFESNDINACWDGTFKGENVPSGIYPIKVRVFTSTLNRFEDYQGKVFVIR